MVDNSGANPYGSSGAVPAPPPELKENSALAELSIRTMGSDLEVLGRTGTVTGSGTKVEIAFEEGERPGTKGKVVVRDNAAARPSAWSTISIGAWIVVGVLGAGGLFFVGYYGVPFVVDYFGLRSSPPPATTGPVPNLPDSSGTDALFLGHDTYFNQPPPVALINIDSVLTEGGVATFETQIVTALQSAPPETNFLELGLVKTNQQQPAWLEFLTGQEIPLLSQRLWAERFEPDFTTFLYRDGAGLWPGYILKIRGKETPLTLQREIIKLETNPSALTRFYLNDPGAPRGDFHDAQILSRPVRRMNLGEGNTAFVYGWFFNSYLILSTSEDGLREAVLRL